MVIARRVLAFAFAPLIGAVVPVVWDVATRSQPVPRPAELLAFWLYFSLFGFAAELVIGVPLLLLYRRFNWLSLPWFLLGGAVAGLAFTLFFALDEFSIVAAWLGLISTDSALVGSLAFWAIGDWSPNNSLQRQAGLRPACR
jgi:hypothetical protein